MKKMNSIYEAPKAQVIEFGTNSAFMQPGVGGPTMTETSEGGL